MGSYVALVVGVALGVISTFFLPEYSNPHRWLPPCNVSQCFGNTAKIKHLSPFEAMQWRVVDGDTLHCEGRRVRLAEIEAPEVRRTCLDETRVGERTRARVVELLQAGGWRATWHPTANNKDGIDDWGRYLVRITLADGSDLAARLIEERLAIAYDENQKASPWCDATSDKLQ